MRICIEKATKKILEMQSEATAGTLIANAVRAGYAAKDIEEREVNATQYTSAQAVCPVHIKEKADKEKAEQDKAKDEKDLKDLADGTAIDNAKDLSELKTLLKTIVKVLVVK
jgi:hypothetical protein